MDTKWKNRKNTVSFLIFFLGISLMAAGLGGIWRDKPSDRKLQELPLIVEENYQHSSRFREYISGVLETFLAIEAGRDSRWTYGLGWNYDVYYEADMEVTEAVEGVLMQQYQNDWDMGEPEHRIPEEEREKYIQKYYDAIKGNKNLLYAVYADGEQKHANFDFASCGILSGEGNFLAKGSVTPPDGYRFLLYFDGGKNIPGRGGAECVWRRLLSDGRPVVSARVLEFSGRGRGEEDSGLHGCCPGAHDVHGAVSAGERRSVLDGE